MTNDAIQIIDPETGSDLLHSTHASCCNLPKL